MKIALGCDGIGYPLKDELKRYMMGRGYDVTDFGVSSAHKETPYFHTAAKVAQKIANREFDRAVLVCGTGTGMAIIANKFPGVYAACCESTFMAEKSRSVNNANILTVGAMVTTIDVAKPILDVWMRTKFTQGWGSDIADWLKDSMNEIDVLEGQQFKKAG